MTKTITKYKNLIIVENLCLERKDVNLMLGRNNYFPDKKYPGNKTFLYEERNNKFPFQVSVHVSIFDVIIPTCYQVIFKNNVFENMMGYWIEMIRKLCPDNEVANKIGFSINFYVEENTPASLVEWWNISGNEYEWNSELVFKTVLGTYFEKKNKRLTMKFEFDSFYKIKCCPEKKIENEIEIYRSNPFAQSSINSEFPKRRRTRSENM